MLKKFGLPRLIILIFLISTYIIAPFIGIPITTGAEIGRASCRERV